MVNANIVDIPTPTGAAVPLIGSERSYEVQRGLDPLNHPVIARYATLATRNYFAE